MRILLVGGGGREHAIAKAVAGGNTEDILYAYMNNRNPGILALSREVRLGRLNQPQAIADYAAEIRADLVIPGPEEPLMHGLADELSVRGIPCAGPCRTLAMLEGDKAFLRQYVERFASQANPGHVACTQTDEIAAAIARYRRVAVKPLGLTSGKGVRVMGKQLRDQADAVWYAEEILARDGRVLVEEFLEGEEFSLMVFTDGERFLPMPLVQDAKYAYEGDSGPMTGGMGAYTEPDGSLPFVTASMRGQALRILEQVIRGSQEDLGQRYHGVVYGQFMATRQGPKIIEVNVRLGDPEAINVMALLTTPAAEVFAGAAGSLPESVEFRNQASACKYLVPTGYPEAVGNLTPVPLNERGLAEKGIQLIYAGAEAAGDQVRPTGSRFAALLAIRDNLERSERAVEECLEGLGLDGLRWRKDVASKALVGQRIDHARSLGIL